MAKGITRQERQKKRQSTQPSCVSFARINQDDGRLLLIVSEHQSRHENSKNIQAELSNVIIAPVAHIYKFLT